MLLTSPDALGAATDQAVVKVLSDLKASSNIVAVISNHDKPEWFDDTFNNTRVQFIKQLGRQNGKIVAENAATLKLEPYDVIVLAGTDTDVQMGKNGGAVVVVAGWSANAKIQSYGICVQDAQELQDVINIATEWNGHWWFSAQRTFYSINALGDLSTYGKQQAQETFAKQLTHTAKQGGSKLTALLTITARSLLMDGIGDESKLAWGVYPSSSSANDDTEVLSDFTHRLRTTVSKVQLAKKGKPLFIRHTPSAKRSSGGGGGDRTDPAGQITTIHVNPVYKGKLTGRHVIVVDDCTTYGVSFAVAAAFLKKAGASKVTGIALGKFGNQLRHYDITINTDPYAPVTDFIEIARDSFKGSNNNTALHDLTVLV